MSTESEWLTILSEITHTEMRKKFKNGLPPCIKISATKYKMGKYAVTKTSLEWELSAKDFGPILFVNLPSAMLYCIYMSDNDLTRASSIKNLSDRVHQLTAEKELFKNRLATATKKKDEWKTDLYAARYSNVTSHLLKETDELRQLLTWSMYTKFKKLTLEIK